MMQVFVCLSNCFYSNLYCCPFFVSAYTGFFQTQHNNTSLGIRRHMVLHCCMWINSHIRTGQQKGELIIYICIERERVRERHTETDKQTESRLGRIACNPTLGVFEVYH